MNVLKWFHEITVEFISIVLPVRIFFIKNVLKQISKTLILEIGSAQNTTYLPFSKVNDNDLLVSIHGFDENSSDFLKNVPSFNIQSLLDQLPGQHFSIDSFLNDTIDYKYYTAAQFIAAKIPKNRFSIIHLNISSLAAHLDELKTLINSGTLSMQFA